MLGHKALRIDHDYSAAFRWIYKAFDIITWVRRDLWHEVILVEEAGVVFEDLFYVSVHCAILDVYQRVSSIWSQFQDFRLMTDLYFAGRFIECPKVYSS